ncbi:MAG: tetratricopeptide repeat protein [Pseudomonadota bacterium]
MVLLICGAVLAVTACQQQDEIQLSAPVAPPPDLTNDPFDVGVRLLAVRQHEMALGAFRRAMLRDGLTAEALTGAAVASMRLGRPNAARKLLESAVTVDPRSAVAHNNLGVALYDVGDYEGAFARFELAFALTEGADQSVAQNLEMAKFALDDSASPKPKLDEADFDVIQYGHGVYRLEPRRETAEPEEQS